MLESAHTLEAADAVQKLIDVLRAPPLAVADHVQAGGFLQPDGEAHGVVEGSRIVALQHIDYGLGPRERSDRLSVEARQSGCSYGPHGSR